MSNKKACVVYALELENEVPELSKQLAAEGFNVCIAAADRDVVEAAKSGSNSIPDEVKACIDNAAICLFLIPKNNSEHVQNAADYAGSSGNKIIAIAEDTTRLPQIFDDLATSVVCIGSAQLPDAIKGQAIWESPNGSTDGKRSIRRIKCQ